MKHRSGRTGSNVLEVEAAQQVPAPTGKDRDRQALIQQSKARRVRKDRKSDGLIVATTLGNPHSGTQLSQGAHTSENRGRERWLVH